MVLFNLKCFRRTSCWLKQLPEDTKFILYGLYGWGLPALLTLIVFVLDKTDIIPSNLRPGIGSTSCFVDKESKCNKRALFQTLAIQ